MFLPGDGMNWIKLLLLSCFLVSGTAHAAEQPNILWLVCEDSSIDWFGCYGNKHAKTPNVDALARQGFRYKNAYACVPVCAPSRSTWITGMYSASTGTLPMRSRYALPHDVIKYYPDYLRNAGYFCANHTKTDYNIGGRPDAACWDTNKPNGWELRKPGQPFFQIINFTESHESKAHGAVTNTRHSPDQIILRKYHPDEKGIRMTYAKYHDSVETMDTEVGKALAALDKSGLANDTIVIFNSDHGGVMPRSKRFLYNSGLHCPLIVRIPEKFKHLWPGKSPGESVERLVSFVDMPKTWLRLANAEIPAAMQGRIFLGAKADEEPEYVFSFRERMDERFDNQRAVRNKQFLYIKNFMPYVPLGQHVDYLWKMEGTKSWEDAYKNKRTNEITGRFFETKPVEELYDMKADPDNVINLAEKPEYRETLLTMRKKLREWQLSIRDTGLLPEFERNERATQNKTTIYQLAQDQKLYNLPAYLDAADMALEKNIANKQKLLALLANTDSGLRYWGTVGLFMLGKADDETLRALDPLLKDGCGEAVGMAAWTMLQSGQNEKGTKALFDQIKNRAPSVLFTLNVLDWSHADIKPFAPMINSMVFSGRPMAEYEQRMIDHLGVSNNIGSPKNFEKPTKNKGKKKE